MKAIVRHEYGSADVLALRDIDVPVAGDDEVLIEVRAASVNPYDWHMMTGKPYLARLSEGLRAPKHAVLGADVAGLVAAVGRDVTRFKPGDEVFGQAAQGYAEYACVKARHAALKPAALTFGQAAAVPIAAVTALQALRDHGRIAAGQRVLINGAAGGVGTFAVQLATSYGAHVTGVCGTGNVDLVRSLGATDVVDYTRADFLRDGQRYDLILDLVANRPLLACRRALTPTGRYVAASTPKDRQWIGPLVFVAKVLLVGLLGGRKMAPMLANTNQNDLDALAALLEAGKVTPVIDRSYPLTDVPDALRYLEKGHARGKVVITV